MNVLYWTDTIRTCLLVKNTKCKQLWTIHIKSDSAWWKPEPNLALTMFWEGYHLPLLVHVCSVILNSSIDLAVEEHNYCSMLTAWQLWVQISAAAVVYLALICWETGPVVIDRCKLLCIKASAKCKWLPSWTAPFVMNGWCRWNRLVTKDGVKDSCWVYIRCFKQSMSTSKSSMKLFIRFEGILVSRSNFSTVRSSIRLPSHSKPIKNAHLLHQQIMCSSI